MRVKSSHNPFDPLSTRSIIVISPPVSSTIGESPIQHIVVLTDAILRIEKMSLVNIRHQVGTSYRTEIFPTVRTGLILYEIVIIVVTIFIIIIIIIYRFLFRRFIFLIFNSRRRI